MSFSSEALFAESMLENLRRKSEEIERITLKKRRLFWGFIGCTSCLAFFLIGFFGGLFVPRKPIQSGISASLTRKWIDEPCTIPDLGRCPDSYDKLNPPLLVISFDGFRAEYLSRNITRAMEKVRKCGVQAESLRPTYPSITFPNHYSIATGLNAESHGIVDKVFYDPSSNRSFNSKSETDAQESIWWKGEPIWVTARKHGKRAHNYFWVGSEAEIHGYRPNEYRIYNESDTFEHRVDTVLSWLSAPLSERPGITMLYFDEPDTATAHHRTHSIYLNNAIRRVDTALERLMQGLHENNMLDCVNIIVLSDHGMTDLKCDEHIDLETLLKRGTPKKDITTNDFIFTGGTQGRLSLTTSTKVTVDDLFGFLTKCDATRNAGKDSQSYQVYKKETLPRRLHYSNSDRLDPIVITMNEGVQFSVDKNSEQNCVGAGHGYDNLYPDMQGIFLAHGPSFKTESKVEPFQNIEIYNLMCDLLGISPAPNNGTAHSLDGLLRLPKAVSNTKFHRVEKAEFPESRTGSVGGSGYCSPKCPKTSRLSTAENLGLNMSRALVDILEQAIAPRGVPQIPADLNALLFVNRDSLLVYSRTAKIPVWSSFILQPNTTLAYTADDSADCIRRDPRIEMLQTLTCSDFQDGTDITPSFLVPPEMLDPSTQSDVSTTVNLIPMYKAFKNGTWKTFWNMLTKWADVVEKIDVQVGPVFDSIAPYGLVDPTSQFRKDIRNPKLLIPSHFYAVVTSNNNLSLCLSEPCVPDVMAFILPHEMTVDFTCQDDMTYLLTHSARVKDVELVTGLKFFTRSPPEERIRLLTRLPTKLWHLPHGL